MHADDALDLDFFARRLDSWLAPEALAEGARRLHSDRAAAERPSALVLYSETIPTSEDAGLKRLVTEYLARFRIPPEVLALVRVMEPAIPESVWAELERLRFTGSTDPPWEGIRPPPSGVPVLVVRERDVVVDILAQPLQGIVGMVSLVARTWLRLRELSVGADQPFLQHNSADPFGAWLDGTVAAECGFTKVAERKDPALRQGPVLGYRAVTIGEWRKRDPRMVDACRRIAQLQAAETLQP